MIARRPPVIHVIILTAAHISSEQAGSYKLAWQSHPVVAAAAAILPAEPVFGLHRHTFTKSASCFPDFDRACARSVRPYRYTHHSAGCQTVKCGNNQGKCRNLDDEDCPEGHRGWSLDK
ncbi:uncharacterized protein K489DRAFT_36479 [Dissoconium aciculare CBS 342.82]|uniref:Uncharacterized protein n=1 Tax=Dissoconium aciculare CBS 342.82 TaxID=1314786 RepID=A0A6J3LY14_9PEZI|nr:uncharacterized protein K489DRAFT_36479 [Dissoconium aciculare CBS 342.82]KAF1820563.1 hypothetical protein K489DRAFT_36479 [Dissoconium aciculare CBS 342.82]